jgi:membrane protein required for colicin V production
LNIFDLILLVIFILFIAVGMYRGFIKESLSLAAWFLAAASAWFFADKVGVLLRSLIAEPTLRVIAGFALIFVVVFVVMAIAKHYLHQFFMSRVYLKIPNYLLGGVIGGLRGGFVIVVAFLVMGLTTLPKQDWWRSSYLAPNIEIVALKCANYLPSDVARHIRYS